MPKSYSDRGYEPVKRIENHATTVVTANTGCHMQMIYGVRKANIPAEVIHLVELLDRSYFKAEAQ